MSDIEVIELVERIHRLAAPRPMHLIVSPENYYHLLVVTRQAGWLLMPFRILRGETKGQVEERWRRRRKALAS